MARRVLLSVVILVPLAAVYWQVGSHSFVCWDDKAFVYANPQVKRGLSLEGVAWGFRTGVDAGFIPLTWISRMADVSLFGLDAGWHHRENVLLHAVNTVLLLLLLHGMTGALWRSAVVAALFALHPLHVESVAWVTERKDVLSTLFWLLTTLSYVRYARKPGARRYAAVAGFFALGLMSKPMLVTLPFTLLLLDWWPLGRLSAGGVAGEAAGPTFGARFARLAVEKAPLFAMSAAAAAATYALVAPTGTMAGWEEAGLGLRASNAVVSCASYLAKAAWPVSLAACYPYPAAGAGHPALGIGAAALALGLVSALVLRYHRRGPWLAVGWLGYLATLLPVIGLVQVGPQAMADRYTYVPLVGIFVAVAWGGFDLAARLRVPRPAVAAASAAVILALAATARVHVGYWKDGVTLFRHAREVVPDNWMACNGLGVALADRGEGDEAAAAYRQALRIRPGYAAAHNNLGAVLFRRGFVDDAVEHFKEAVRIRPRYVEAYNNLAIALSARGQADDAVRCFGEAIRISPEFVDAHNNLGTVLSGRGRVDEAIAAYREGLRHDPNHAGMHKNLGVALARLGDIDGAVAQLRTAVRIDPAYAEAHNDLGIALAMRGSLHEAADSYREALRLRPGFPEAHNNLGNALSAMGRVDEAVAQYRAAMKSRPDYPDARANLERALAAGRGR